MDKERYHSQPFIQLGVGQTRKSSKHKGASAGALVSELSLSPGYLAITKGQVLRPILRTMLREQIILMQQICLIFSLLCTF